MANRLLAGPGLVVPISLLATVLALAAAANPLVALGGLGAALLVGLMVLRPEALVVVLVAALPWEDALAYPTQTISVVKILGVLLFAAWLLSAIVTSRQLRLPSTLLPVALFAFALGLSLLFSPDPVYGIGKTLRYALFTIFFFLVIQLTADRGQVRRLLRVISLSAAGAAAVALYEFLFVGQIDRAAGPISDPNDFAYFIACVLPLVAYLLSSERARRPLWTVCFILLAAAMLATLSRGALVGLAALAVWGVATRRVPLSGLVLGAAALASVAALAFALWAPLLQDRLTLKGHVAGKNVISRQAFWIAAAEMGADRPLTGVGPGRFSVEAKTYVRNNPIVMPYPVVHNSYLEILAENGIFAMLAFIGFLAGTWQLLGRARRVAIRVRDVDGRRLATAMQATMLIAIVSASFLSEQLTTPFWLIGALATVVARMAAEEAPAAAPPRTALPLAA